MISVGGIDWIYFENHSIICDMNKPLENFLCSIDNLFRKILSCHQIEFKFILSLAYSTTQLYRELLLKIQIC